jgi:hypothetical protein
MAINFLNTVDFTNIPTEGFALENLGTDPPVSQEGSLYYNTEGDIVKVYTGAGWKSVGQNYSFDISDGSTTDTISSGDTIQFNGQNAITVEINPTPLGPDYVRISHDNITRTNTTSTAAPAFGDTFEAIASITTNSQGHVTAVDTTTVTIPGSGTMTGEISMNSNKITNLSNPTSNQDAASKAYVDGLVTGGLTFKDGFDAGSGAIVGGGNLTTGGSRVALSVGDFYVVTTGGMFYGSVYLDIGDSVICKTAASQGTSTAANWVIVQSDEGVTQFSSSNAMTASTGQAITSQTASVGSVTVQSFAYNGGSNVGHVPSGGDSTRFLRGDGTWVVPTDTGALGKRIVLNSALSYVTVADAGGVRTFTVDVSNANVFDTGAAAIDVKCEVITAAGATVYADITRSSANLSVAFVGTPANSAYEVLLTYVG